jgi:hypothetical protein
VVILSLRATGEGHFFDHACTGVIHVGHRIEVFRPPGFLTEPARLPTLAENRCLRKLSELG